MSDNLPFEIQVEIICRLPVKSLIQFRSVSKSWKSLIDSSDFISRYSGQHTQMQQQLVTCYDPAEFDYKYVLFPDDDTFPQQKTRLTFPKLLNRLAYYHIVGCSHGLLCLYGCLIKGRGVNKSETHMVVFWNLSIRKFVTVIVPNNIAYDKMISTAVGFGVCEATTDPKVIKISVVNQKNDMFSAVEVFTLSTGVWRSSYSNQPRKSIRFDQKSVYVDGFIYWIATDMINMDAGVRFCHLIVSFDLTSEEFGEINLPRAKNSYYSLLSKLRNSLVVLEYDVENNNSVVVVWMMEDGVTKSFAKLFTIDDNGLSISVKGLRKTCAPIVQIYGDGYGELVVYEPYLKDINIFCVYGKMFSFAVYQYVETLLLLDQPDHM